jgi:hypothetical protein
VSAAGAVVSRPMACSTSSVLADIASDPASTSSSPSTPADTVMLAPAPTIIETFPRMGRT